MNGVTISWKFELEYFLFMLFQLVSDDYVATSSESVGRVPKPKEVPRSEASVPNLSSSTKTEAIIIESLRKEVKVLKAQCLTAINQSKKSSDREEAARLRAKESTEAAQVATAKLTQAMDRESYMLEMMTTASQELIGKFLLGAPVPNFLDFSLDD